MAKFIHVFLVVLLFALSLGSSSAFAQAPQAIPYQAIARSNVGNTLVNQPISIRMSIRNLTSTGTILYQETHAVTTNSLGLFTLNIGQGTVVSGTFSTINWGTGNKFIQTEMDPTGGTTYTNMGTEQFRSVPYALFAANGGTAGAGYTATSTSSVLIGLGSKTFTTQSGLAYLPNMRVRIANSASNYMEGVVTSYSTTSLVVSVDRIIGSGTFASWNIGIAGDVGAQGLTGATGATGAQGIQGVTGSQGIQGIAGATGATGATGSQGVAGAGYTATSTTSNSIAIASKTFTTQSGLAYLPNMRVRVANSATNYMEGTVTSYSTTSLVVNVTRIVGSGTFASWNIGIAGDVGATGTTGATGSTGATGAQGIQGIQGVAGATGATGATGAQGIQGVAGAGYTATSTTSSSITIGSKTMSTQTGLAYLPNMRVRIANSVSNYMEGVVTSYSTNVLVVNVDRVVGSGTFTSWNIGIAGDVGATGATGTSGLLPNGSVAGNTPYWNGTTWVTNSNNIFNNGANVGIGSNPPSSKLHVTGDILSTGTFGSGSNVGLSGSGTRMFFNPKKAAFRAGYVASDGWNNDSIGDYSFGAGFDSKATASGSSALGIASTASGFASSANGYTTNASGDRSTAMGSNTAATGDFSTAMGFTTTAAGRYSTSMGEDNKANGYASLVIGSFNDNIVAPQTSMQTTTPLFIIGNGTSDVARSNVMVARNDGKVGIGTNAPSSKLHVAGDILSTGTFGAGEDVTITGGGTRMFFNPKKGAFRAGEIQSNQWDNDSVGTHSFAIGYNTKATGSQSFATGYNTIASGLESFATGLFTTASGHRSFSTGFNTIASGEHSVSIGYSTIASGTSSVAIGQATTASGILSLATGQNTIASGQNATSLGEGTKASGYASLATGVNTNASALNSTAMGIGTKASNLYSLVIGQNNDTTITNTLFEIGNGASFTSRSNAMVVRNDGNVGIGNLGNAIPSKLTIQGDASNPSIPSTTSTGVARIAVNNQEGIDFGKMGVNPYSAWMQSGYQGFAEPMVINPLGGNVGIATSTPITGFDVNTNAKIGVNGTPVAAIIRDTKSSIQLNLVSVAAGTTLTRTYSVPNALTSGAVFVSPVTSLPTNFSIDYQYIPSNGVVSVTYRNNGTTTEFFPQPFSINIGIIQ